MPLSICARLPPEQGYNHQNPLRTESATTAAAEIDARIAQAWELHPKRFIVESSSDFLDKAARALETPSRRSCPSAVSGTSSRRFGTI